MRITDNDDFLNSGEEGGSAYDSDEREGMYTLTEKEMQFDDYFVNFIHNDVIRWYGSFAKF